MSQQDLKSLRWYDYVLERGDSLGEFWQSHFADAGKNVLFILARSFDPRTCVSLQQLIERASPADCRAFVLSFAKDAEDSSDLEDRANANLAQVRELIGSTERVKTVMLNAAIDSGHRYTSQSVTGVFSSFDQIRGNTDIIVDVSGMPRSVFFPLLCQLLYLIDSAAARGDAIPNLFTVVSEDPRLDAAIRHEGIDEFAELLPRFRGGFDREATADWPNVWIPILGEHRQTQLERIEDLIKPTEMWPVLPSPSRHPRRGDELVQEYHGYLFGNHRIDPRNFIYASEDNPFEVYRQLCRAVRDCRETLAPLGGCNIAFSALSSKLTSLGALLAAYDLKTTQVQPFDIGVAHVGCKNYQIDDCDPDTEVFGLWLTGRCYEVE